MAISAKQKETLQVVARTGFTFKGDSHFASYRQACVTLSGLVREDLIKRDGDEYRLTSAGRDWCEYGILPAETRA